MLDPHDLDRPASPAPATNARPGQPDGGTGQPGLALISLPDTSPASRPQIPIGRR
ncbi:MAG: hypothetical protein JWQ26_2420 [Modestobacter sp.]|jgi:hypothetical protein|nr:hypothetical protein [Modestobacter sp.]